ncbi:MAG: Transposase DDE domain protein [Chloroflexi bacterium ADurb.Bin180]|nr:MAG: Transposase DDE domain protein [Chloroflexi bacterium ADurb.Bin180]
MLDPSPRTPVPASRLAVDSPYIYSLLIAPDEPLRQINAHVDFSCAREVAQDLKLYDECRGRYGVEPELFARVCFLQYRDDVSDEETMARCASDLRWKWFLGLDVDAPAPFTASALSKIRKRWGEEGVLKLLHAVNRQATELGLVDDRTHLVDSGASIANAALMSARKFILTVCEKLIGAMKPVIAEGRHEELCGRHKTLREDTSWYLSDEAKAGHLAQWGAFCAELVEQAERLLAEPGAVGELADWERHAKRLRRRLDIARHHLQDRQEKQKTKKKDKMASPTDPDARRSCRSNDKVKSGYRSHIEMDAGSQLVMAIEGAPANVEDGPVLPDLVKQAMEQGHKPENCDADGAYADGENRQFLKDNGITAHIQQPKPKKSKKGLFIATDFTYNAADQTVTCPNGAVCCKGTPQKTRGGFNYYFRKAICDACPLRDKCIAPGETRGRTVYIAPQRELTDQAREAQKGEEHQTAMKGRLAVERKLAEMLRVHGLRHCRYRGLDRYRIQLGFTAITVNIKRIAKLVQLRDAEAAQGPHSQAV